MIAGAVRGLRVVSNTSVAWACHLGWSTEGACTDDSEVANGDITDDSDSAMESSESEEEQLPEPPCKPWP